MLYWNSFTRTRKEAKCDSTCKGSPKGHQCGIKMINSNCDEKK